MFGTQKLAPMLRRAKNAFTYERSACFDGDSTIAEDDDCSEDADEGEGGGRQRDPQRDVRILAEMLDIDISLIFVSDQVSMKLVSVRVLLSFLCLPSDEFLSNQMKADTVIHF